MFTRITSNGGRSYLQIIEPFRNVDGKPRPQVRAEECARLLREVMVPDPA